MAKVIKSEPLSWSLFRKLNNRKKTVNLYQHLIISTNIHRNPLNALSSIYKHFAAHHNRREKGMKWVEISLHEKYDALDICEAYQFLCAMRVIQA